MDFEQDLTSDEQQFLRALHDSVGGDPGGNASMYAVGETLGMDRAVASRTAENLMSWELVEVRTLSGAIGVTPAGADLIGASGGGEADAGLGKGPVVDEAARRRVEAVAGDLKSRIGGMGLGYDQLSELTADLKTIDAQLGSPRPKTAVLRACLESIEDAVSEAGAPELRSRILDLLNA
jgi:hypothetical protein